MPVARDGSIIGAYLLCLWVLPGCGCDFPGFSTGGSDTLVETLRDALTDFFEGVPEGSVCISRVEFRDLPKAEGGLYDPDSRQIAIEEDPDRADNDPHYRLVMTHEACHAAQFQMEIPLEPAEVWSSTDARVQADVDVETFAYICQAGPKTIQLFAPSCEEDLPGLEAYDLLRKELYTRDVPGLVDVDLTWQPVSSTLFPGAASVGLAVTGTQGDAIRLALGDGSYIKYVSAWTGADASPFPALVPTGETPKVQGASVTAWATAVDANLIAVKTDLINGGLAHRLLYEDADGIASLGCPRLQETVFAQDGRLWSAYADGDLVTWGYWE